MIDFSQVTNITLGSTPVEQIADSLGNVLWSVIPPVVLPNYFYVEDVSGSDNTLSIVKYDASAPTIEVFKSTDQENWVSMGTTSDTAITATVPANGKLYLKATANAWGSSGETYNCITASGNHNVGGNAMSLIYGDNFQNQTTFPAGEANFCGLFRGDTTLLNASQLLLPATTITPLCYEYMFRGCTSLVTAPELPATTLTNSCYAYMFDGCSVLTTAPELPATTLARYCYRGMFNGCTSLTTAPALPATTLEQECYRYMFYKCTALTTAPALPATTLVIGCYFYMFDGCSNLNKVTTYATNISAGSCLSNWLNNVAATGDFYNLGGATYPSGTSGIPTGWTEHTSL